MSYKNYTIAIDMGGTNNGVTLLGADRKYITSAVVDSHVSIHGEVYMEGKQHSRVFDKEIEAIRSIMIIS